MGRVIGDDSLYLYIQDVMVLPEYLRQGIGSRTCLPHTWMKICVKRYLLD
jgi:hypothetical protein